MNNQETKEHLLNYIQEKYHDIFSWPTDACGYDQHIKFVKHRNENWGGGDRDDWNDFIREYAESL